MRVFILGDSNVDVTVGWQEAESQMGRLSPRNRKLLVENMLKSRQEREDVEYYLDESPEELSQFFNSLSPRVEFGGCGAIKARTMAMLGHEVVFYSWVGDDKNGRMILDGLNRAGVDTSHVLVGGKTCETFNLFDPHEGRLAFSFWEPKLDLAKFTHDAKAATADKIFLTGAHRIKDPLGYSRLHKAYVFTGSFAAYSAGELDRKYAADFSKGILIGNESEVMQLSRVKNPVSGMRALPNRVIIMHGADETMVKRGSGVIEAKVPPADRSKAKELTGLGDVWEAFFLSAIGDIEAASEKEIRGAMGIASRAAVHRMMTGEFPVVV